MEVFVLRHVIPSAISSKTSTIIEKIDELIARLSDTRFKASSKNSGASSSNNTEFSVTDYFFISSYIAKKRPDIPESAIGIVIIIITVTIIVFIIIITIIIIIVLAYRSAIPSNLNKTFNKIINGYEKRRLSLLSSSPESSSAPLDYQRPHVLLVTVVADFMKILVNLLVVVALHIGVLPDFVQTLVVRLLQVPSSLSSSLLILSSSFVAVAVILDCFLWS